MPSGNRPNKGTWTEAFDRLVDARANGAPDEELQRQADAELDRLTDQED